MILPQSYLGALLLTVFSMLCLGSWAAAYKITPKWRFELFYFDFALGVMVTAMVCAFTFGNLGFDGFSIMDDVAHAGKRQWLLAFGAGVVFNLGNMFVMAALSISGMSVAFPIGMGFTFLVGILVGQVSQRTANGLFLLLGCVAILLAIAFDAMGFQILQRLRRQAAVKDGKAKSARGLSAFKPVLLAAVGGLLMGCMYPLLRFASFGEIGLGPYSLVLFMSAGILFSTFIFNMFFMNLPVHGEPLELMEYLKSNPKFHLFGLLGGVLWCVGTVVNYVAASAPPEAQIGRALMLTLSEGSTILAALWGLLVWKEFANGNSRSVMLVALALILFAAGLGLFGLAVTRGAA